ncbi:Clp protease N-terminal domain-containing protein [Deinococcus sp.]
MDFSTIMILARDEAASLQHSMVNPEHILLALSSEHSNTELS